MRRNNSNDYFSLEQDTDNESKSSSLSGATLLKILTVRALKYSTTGSAANNHLKSFINVICNAYEGYQLAQLAQSISSTNSNDYIVTQSLIQSFIASCLDDFSSPDENLQRQNHSRSANLRVDYDASYFDFGDLPLAHQREMKRAPQPNLSFFSNRNRDLSPQARQRRSAPPYRLESHRAVALPAPVQARLPAEEKRAQPRQAREEKIDAPPLRPQIKVPSKYVCPITMDIMSDPVYLSNDQVKHRFERSAIKKWIGQHGTHPLNRRNVANDTLVTDKALQNDIGHFKRATTRAHKISASLHAVTTRKMFNNRKQEIADFSVLQENGLTQDEIIYKYSVSHLTHLVHAFKQGFSKDQVGNLSEDDLKTKLQEFSDIMALSGIKLAQ